VLRSFADNETERVWQRRRVRKLDGEIQRGALRTLLILDAAETLDDLRVPPGNRLEKLREAGLVPTASASTSNGASASGGRRQGRRMSRSSTITEAQARRQT
jgi:hypothetical protein